jgi:uncharacterized protein YgbK (DUF1537 family)
MFPPFTLMSRLLLTFYGDDFTGSTDALEQLALAGLRAALFVEPPTPAQLKKYSGLQAIGVAGMTRSLAPAAMERELRPALKKLKALGAPHVHYKVCSTFDSSPTIGSIGRVIDVAASIFNAPFVPLLVAAPSLGRHCVFGNLFARMGIGSRGTTHRLDRHPSMSQHPVTPMNEADLRLHLAKQTRRRIRLFDILKLELPKAEARPALKKIVTEGAEVILFDALYPEQLPRIGELIDAYASRRRPLFSVGSSGIETALAAHWRQGGRRFRHVDPVSQIIVASGSCSPVTTYQIRWALANGFHEVILDAAALLAGKRVARVIQAAVDATVRHLDSGRSVIVHTGRRMSHARNAKTARILGSALGEVLRRALSFADVRRICVAGGDTASYAGRALGVEALKMIAPLTPGAPLCRAHAPGSPVDGRQIVFKGGQVGAENYFGHVVAGGIR